MRTVGALGTLGWIVFSALACSSGSGSSSEATGGAKVTSGGDSGTGGARPSGGTTNGNGNGGSGTGGGRATGGGATGGVSPSGGNSGGGSNQGGAGSATGGSATGGGATGGAGGAVSGAGGAEKGGSTSGGNAGNAGASGGFGGGASESEKFSFFVTSLAGMRKLSGSQDGFGGDLRFGEKSGLEGADKICRTLAEESMPEAGQKEWRAFLSTKSVNAADRVGEGPWHDRLGRLVAKTKSDLLQTRPSGADPAIIEDLPNENGTPNGQDGCVGSVCPDNHDTLTGSLPNGEWDENLSTCDDWTSTEASGQPRIGHSWSAKSGLGWISTHAGGGCKAGVQLQPGDTIEAPTVGAGGGYGAIYCFAVTR